MGRQRYPGGKSPDPRPTTAGRPSEGVAECQKGNVLHRPGKMPVDEYGQGIVLPAGKGNRAVPVVIFF